MSGPAVREGMRREHPGTLAFGTRPPPISSALLNSCLLILIGASLGVFWREVSQVTLRAIEVLGG